MYIYLPIGLCLVAGMGWKPRMKLFRDFFFFWEEAVHYINATKATSRAVFLVCFCEQQRCCAPPGVAPDLRQNVLDYGSKHVFAS